MASRTSSKQRRATPSPAARRPSGAGRPAPTPLAADASVTRALVLGIVALVLLAFWTSANDVYGVPKFVVLLVGTGLLVAQMAWSASSAGIVARVASPAVRCAAAVVALVALATALNGLRALSLVGEYGRNGGLLAFLCGLVLLYATAAAFDVDDARAVVWVLVAVGTVVVLYGLLQVLGAEPFAAPTEDSVVATLGQPNFVGGFLGILAPLLIWVGLGERHPAWARAGAGAVLVGALAVALEADSFQVLPAAVVGAALPLLVGALGRWPARRVVQVVGAGFVAAVLVAVALHGPLERQIRSGFDERVLMWQAGGHMVADRPLLGNGPAGYAARFSEERPAAHARRFGPTQLSDAPHDVPLWYFVTGGIVLGLAYLAFVGLVGWALVRGLRQTSGERRALLAGLGGAWVAYQVQSLVSIDIAALIALHFVLAGAVLVTSGAVTRTAVQVAMFRPLNRRSGARPAALVARGLGILVALVAVVFAGRVLLADVTFAHARVDRASGDLPTALDELQRSTGLAGWNGRYWAERAGTLAATGDQAGALAAGTTAARRSPGFPTYALSAAQLLDRMGQPAEADRWYRIGLAESPNVASASQAYAAFLFSHDRGKAALPHARAAVVDDPANAHYWQLLAVIAADVDRPAEAESAWREVVAIQPANLEAINALARVLTDRGKADEAVTQARVAVAAQPRSVIYLDTLAAALDAAGSKAEARATWTEALRLEPEDPEARAAVSG